MFENLVGSAVRSRGATAIGAWARIENAAAARRLSAMADLLEAKLADADSAERDQWCLDNWDAVSAEVGAAQNVSPGVASNELLDAWALRTRLPRVAEVFATGAISYRLARSVVKRTRLIADRDARAKVDVEIAAQITAWGSLSVAKQEAEIDYWVDRFDPAALVRAEASSRSCHVDVTRAENGSGVCHVEAVLHEQDGEVLDRRLDTIARSVCNRDPRTMDQRRSAAMGAMAAKADRLVCLCGADDCEAAQRTPTAVVVHVIADEESLTDDTPVAMHGDKPPEPESEDGQCRDPLSPPPATGPAKAKPALILGGGILPAPLLAATLAHTATIKRLVHPGQSPPEPRYTPSQKLADFVRCRDLTCRFPGCDVPADRCDLDHTVAYPVGPTQASNLKALCRKHHLLKTFWDWKDAQDCVGTVVWTSPGGQVYTTHPGSRLMFPALCRPTAPVPARPSERMPARTTPMGAGMPRRSRPARRREADASPSSDGKTRRCGRAFRTTPHRSEKPTSVAAMRVFVTGGTGAIGGYAVPALTAAGHDVTAMARSDAKAAVLQQQGATAVKVSLFDRDALTAAFRDHSAVVNLASALPPPARFMFKSAWRECHRIRTQGSATVVDAALSAGVGRVVQESVAMIYRDGGPRWIDEDWPVDHYPIAVGNHGAEASSHRFGETGRDAVILRFGFFYGAGAGHSEMMMRLVRRHLTFQVGKPDSYMSSIHLADAAAAVVAALEVAPATYNVVDDCPVTAHQHSAAMAAAVGVRARLALPGRAALLLGDRATSMTRSLRVDNARLRAATPWRPRYPSVWDGYQAMARTQGW